MNSVLRKYCGRVVAIGLVVAIGGSLLAPRARGADKGGPQGAVFSVDNESGRARTINVSGVPVVADDNPFFLDLGVNGRRCVTCHQPSEKVTGTEIPFAWFAHGLRMIDVKDPHGPREVAHFMPDVPQGTDRVSSNDVTVDDRGLIYLIDRRRGLTIVERL